MCATFCTWICEEYVYCRAFMLKVCLCKRVYFIFKKKPLCSVIVHICNIYVNRKENIGIMKPVKVVLCHLTATICSSPKDLMFKSLMKKKLSLIMSNYFSKEMKIANPCHVQENVMLWRILPMWMFSWGYELTWLFLVLVLVLYMCISKCVWCVKDLYSW